MCLNLEALSIGADSNKYTADEICFVTGNPEVRNSNIRVIYMKAAVSITGAQVTKNLANSRAHVLLK